MATDKEPLKLMPIQQDLPSLLSNVYLQLTEHPMSENFQNVLNLQQPFP